jgi:NADH:ubiquinone oxidoreductase subunit 6 (subunit J)
MDAEYFLVLKSMKVIWHRNLRSQYKVKSFFCNYEGIMMLISSHFIPSIEVLVLVTKVLDRQ